MITGFDIEGLKDATTAQGAVVRVLVARHSGSSPRETGTSMLVWQGGASGTIGGGALEFEAITTARSMLVSGKRAKVLKMPLGPALGQCCGGSVTLVLELYSATSLPTIHQEIFARPVTQDLPCERPLAVIRAIANMRNQREPQNTVLTGDWLIEAMVSPDQPLWLYGAGHVGRAIVEVLADLPFEITWVDTAPDRFPDRIPNHATPLVAQNPAQVVRHAPANAHHLVLTYSHALDLDICHAVLAHDHTTLGLIGSATKRTRFTKRLRSLGHPDASIAKMICPIGQRALGKTPKAIAIGIASELLQFEAEKTQGKEARK
ncbi:MAG: xanthine dehydrogenase accessory protein XdhC [Rhodobacteraceae bacterium]|nr:xanthine dehydrogenase accessory protein XdhC [Paracoccaceae bacterium]